MSFPKKIPAQRLLLGTGVIAVFLTVPKAVYELFLRASYEGQMPFTWDSTIYWAVGRGLLNGLTPYSDLWDNKPPGVYLLSATSLFLTGDASLGHILEVAMILVLPALFLVWARHKTGKLPASASLFFTLIAFLFGTVLTLFLMERSGEYQVESFGAFFGTLYVLLIVWRGNGWGKREIACATLCLLLSIGFKEPFLLTSLASALLLSDSLHRFFRIFILPLMIAAGVGIICMVALGFLQPYFELYLPMMMGSHIQTHGPLWQRGLQFKRVFDDLNGFAVPLGFCIAFLFPSALILQWKNRQDIRRWALLCLRGITALYILVLAVGLGGEFWNHHFAVAVPGIAALSFLFLESVAKRWNDRLTVLLLALCGILITVALFHVPHSYKDRLQNLLSEGAAARAEAHRIDAVLDACHVERYLFLGSNGPHIYGYTKHSPEGPLFATFSPPLDYVFNHDRPRLRNAFLLSLARTRIIVLDAYILSDLTDSTKAYVEGYFSQNPWPCAAPHLGPSRYRILFRSP